MWRKIDERDKNSKEPKDVQDHDESLNLGQQSCSYRIDKDTYEQSCAK